jgi:hypothetical protein
VEVTLNEKQIRRELSRLVQRFQEVQTAVHNVPMGTYVDEALVDRKKLAVLNRRLVKVSRACVRLQEQAEACYIAP